MRDYIKTNEGRVTSIVFLFGLVLVCAGAICMLLDHTILSTCLISVGTSIVASAIISMITASYLSERDKRNELAAQWGIAAINKNRSKINIEVDECFRKRNHNLDIIAFGLKSFREAQTTVIARKLKQGLKVRIITVDPKCPLLAYRDQDEEKKVGSTKQSIEQLIEWVSKMKKETQGEIEVRYLNTLPTEVYFRVDNSIFAGPYQIGKESQQTITTEYRHGGEGYSYYYEYFNRIWEQAVPGKNDNNVIKH